MTIQEIIELFNHCGLHAFYNKTHEFLEITEGEHDLPFLVYYPWTKDIYMGNYHRASKENLLTALTLLNSLKSFTNIEH